MNIVSSPRAFSRKAPVVAIHCSASGPRQWHGYRSLLEAGVTLETPHLLGYAQEDPWINGLPVTLESEAYHLYPVLVGARQPVHLVAHSYGGAVAVQAALLWPGLVRSLTLYEPGVFQLLMQDPASARQVEEIMSVARRVGLLSISNRRQEAAELFVDYWSGPGAWTHLLPERRADIAGRMSKVRAEFEAIFHSRMEVAKLEQSGMPIRVVCGDASPGAARRTAELLCERVPSAELVCLPGQKHMAPVLDRDALAPLLFPFSLREQLPLAA